MFSSGCVFVLLATAANTVPIDLNNNGKADGQASITPVDVSGDGKADALAIDTSGDGNLDTLVAPDPAPSFHKQVPVPHLTTDPVADAQIGLQAPDQIVGQQSSILGSDEGDGQDNGQADGQRNGQVDEQEEADEQDEEQEAPQPPPVRPGMWQQLKQNAEQQQQAQAVWEAEHDGIAPGPPPPSHANMRAPLVRGQQHHRSHGHGVGIAFGTLLSCCVLYYLMSKPARRESAVAMAKSGCGICAPYKGPTTSMHSSSGPFAVVVQRSTGRATMRNPMASASAPASMTPAGAAPHDEQTSLTPSHEAVLAHQLAIMEGATTASL